MNRLITVIALTSLTAMPANAQSASAFDVLGQPVGPMMACYPIPASPADSAAVMLHFFDGRSEQEQRETMVAYDSTGVALYFTLLARELTAEGVTRTHVVAGRLSPAPFGGRSVLSDTASSGQAASSQELSSGGTPRSGSIPLTDAELRRARALAERLWGFPCRETPHRR